MTGERSFDNQQTLLFCILQVCCSSSTSTAAATRWLPPAGVWCPILAACPLVLPCSVAVSGGTWEAATQEGRRAEMPTNQASSSQQRPALLLRQVCGERGLEALQLDWQDALARVCHRCLCLWSVSPCSGGRLPRLQLAGGLALSIQLTDDAPLMPGLPTALPCPPASLCDPSLCSPQVWQRVGASG